MIESWTKLIQDYLSYRTSLKAHFICWSIFAMALNLMIRNDESVRYTRDFLSSYFDKDDKVSSHHSQTIYDQTYHQIKNHAAAYPEIISTSAQTKGD